MGWARNGGWLCRIRCLAEAISRVRNREEGVSSGSVRPHFAPNPSTSTMGATHMVYVTSPEPVSVGCHSQFGVMLSNVLLPGTARSGMLRATIGPWRPDTSPLGVDRSIGCISRLFSSIHHGERRTQSRDRRKSTLKATIIRHLQHERPQKATTR